MDKKEEIKWVPERADEDIQVDEFVKQFNNYWGLTARGTEHTVDQFYNFINFDGLTNKETMISSYTPEEMKLYTQNGDKPTLIKTGIVFSFPQDSVVIETMLIKNKNQFLKQQGFNAYVDDLRRALLDDPMYYRATALTLDVAKDYGAFAQQMNLNIRVWIYCKALGGLVDISPLVESCSTSKSKQVGNFALTVNPIKVSHKDPQVKSDNTSGDSLLSKFNYDISYQSQSNVEGYINSFNIWDRKRKLTLNFFDEFVQENDLVFIRFEKLACETDVTTIQGQYLPTSVLGNSSDIRYSDSSKYLVWDMIGLIDTVSTSHNLTGNDVTTTIRGRDLMKLVQDDGNWFYAYKFISGNRDSVLFMGDTNSKSFQRNFVTGQFDNYHFNAGWKRIDEYISFIISQISLLEIVDNSVFAGYGDRRSKLSIPGDDGGLKEKVMQGIWSIVKIFIDPSINGRVFAGDLGGANGNILQLLNRACQEPFVELYGDTSIDMYTLIARQPPFTKQAIQDIVQGQYYISVKNEDVYSINLSYDNTVYSWYELRPTGTLATSLNEGFSALLPVIFFPEIAKYFGNKRLQVEDQYVRMGPQKGEEKVLNQENLFSAAVSDLLYLIETNVYLPFTRKGTIVMNGDRRIRVGTFIKLEPTNELFYVTQVDNSMTVTYNGLERTTTLTVERGMKWDLIYGNQQIDVYNWKNEDGISQQRYIMNSYFDIVNTQEMFDLLNRSINNSQSKDNLRNEVLGSTKINNLVYEYFLKRRYSYEYGNTI